LTDVPGKGGSGGANGINQGIYAAGGAYGGGGQGYNIVGPDGGGGVGAVRIIWSFAGVTRSFPSTNTGDL
jgi:hypothetical protein